MYLKELYISGFKSFANPVKLHFDKEVSAIVGPNGSGKSNISDSIRFVLGEQRTKQLRSQKMEDIIFSGTDTQNPRGAAEVSLTLENDDETDLIISRKYFRTGDSNYYLNGRRVRLKDIQSIFNDTGLGKNGYSIVSQGGVENIIGASPSTLRELVEEALGLSGIKMKRNETERRLLQTKDNIERIKDILGEIEKQLKPLKRQAKKTRRYLEINDVLKVIDLVSYFDEKTKRDQELEEKTSLINISNTVLKDLEDQAFKLDQEYVKTENKVLELRKEIEDFNRTLFETQKEVSELNNRQIKNKADKTYLANELKRFQAELENLELKSNELKTEYKNLSEKNLKENQVFKEKQELLSSKEKSLEELRDKINQLNEENRAYEKNQRSITDLNDRKLKIQTELIEVQLKIDHLKQSRDENLKLVNQIENETLEEETSIKELKKNLSILKEDYTESLNTKNSLLSKQKKYSKELESLRVNFNTLNNQLDYQKSLKNSLSGFQNSVKAVLNYSKQKNKSDIIGPVADLFTVDSKYSLAIQTALGNRAQNIVIDNEKSAKEYIDYLRNSKKGRATFLPLNAIKYSNIDDYEKKRLSKENGFISIASDLVKTEDNYKKVFTSLIGRVVIIDNYNNARVFRNKINKYTIVTLTGEIFYPGGAIVGGSNSKESRYSFFHSMEINNIEDQIKNVSQRIQNGERILLELNGKLEHLNTELVVKDNKVQILKQDIFLKDQKIKELNSQKMKVSESSTKEYDNLVLKNNRLENELQHLNNEIAKSSHKDFTYKDKSELDQEYEKEINNITKLKVEISTLVADLRHSKDRLVFIQNSLAENNIKKDQLVDSKDNSRLKISELDKNIKDLDCLLEDKNKKLSDLNQNKVNQAKELEKLEKLETNLESEVKKASKQRLLEVEAKSKLERIVDRLNEENKNSSQYIFNQYGMNYAMIKDEIDYLRKQKQTLSDQEVNELRREMIKLGSVNTDAISDYNNLKERFDELDSQYTDLLTAEKDILKTIKTINKTIVLKFTDKFDILNKKFNETFSLLFNGGKADLKFSDKKDLLNSGIELSAQPPGKKLKSINLLSGGEKAMTAISLLFSFIELNPAPFTLIDEIDAALDDSNIGRFTNYLKKISDKNQFIIITHRKSTLRICDKINGITMASDGISRLCTLELADYVE